MDAANPFEQYIQGWIDKYGTAQRLADAVGMTLSAFLRGVRNEHTLGIENCLRFAEETGEPPGKVLRLAGKGEVADLLERLYGGGGQGGGLSATDRDLVTLWHSLTADARKPLLTVMRELQQRRRRRSSPGKGGAGKGGPRDGA